MEALIGIREASTMLGLRVSTLYSYVERKIIPHVKLGTRLLFEPQKLEQWVEKRAVAPVVEAGE
jgi:excisionase family DNA binding protein